MSVRITATGAVAFALLSWLTVPVSACDERYIKKCESTAAATVVTDDSAASVRRKPARRVHTVISRHSRNSHFARPSHVPGFAVKQVELASAESRLSNARPESALSRRFRGFINPTPMAQNGFEPFRKPHIVALNLEPPVAADGVETVADAADVPAAPEPHVEAPKPAAMTLASAESRPVTLGEPTIQPAPVIPQQAVAAPAPTFSVAQAYVSESQAAPKEPDPSRFPVHQLVIALCGALGAASALRFIVGV